MNAITIVLNRTEGPEYSPKPDFFPILCFPANITNTVNSYIWLIETHGKTEFLWAIAL